jgi:hypothetical protein
MPRVVPSDVLRVLRSFFPDGQEIPLLLPAQSGPLAAIVELLDEVPTQLLTVAPPEVYTGLIAGRAAIRDTLAGWRGGGRMSLRWEGFNVHPIDLIREALLSCPDEAAAPGTPELLFIPEPDVREHLQRDLSAVRNALANDEAKAATVLAGSTLEALLLWALQRRPPADIEAARGALVAKRFGDPGPDLTSRSWSLSAYIEVASHLGLIRETPTAQQARLAKDYRNLIHPAAAIRLKQECNRGAALGAAAALELVIRDLELVK